jgi:hypothetical protein
MKGKILSDKNNNKQIILMVFLIDRPFETVVHYDSFNIIINQVTLFNGKF